jgi:antagonist of KipI
LPNTFAIRFIFGSEWQWLTRDSQNDFREKLFQITNEADRMGYRLASSELELNTEEQLISSGVAFGTVQLLPKGQLIILMADHQTTGGYPRIANIISADLPLLAQKGPNDVIQFQQTDLITSERLYMLQQKELKQIMMGSKFKMENLLHDINRS